MIRKRVQTITVCLLLLGLAGARAAAAQDQGSFEFGGQLATVRLGEFDAGDVGIGVNGAWRVTPLFAVEGALSWFPGGDAEEDRIKGQQKLLGLVGVRAGIQRGPLELFARARPGFLRFSGEDNVPCILIFPVPLECQLLAGQTSFVTEIGAGAHVAVGRSQRMFVSFDIGDLLVRYGSESLRPNGEVSEDGFVSHNLVANVGVGWKF